MCLIALFQVFVQYQFVAKELDFIETVNVFAILIEIGKDEPSVAYGYIGVYLILAILFRVASVNHAVPNCVIGAILAACWDVSRAGNATIQFGKRVTDVSFLDGRTPSCFDSTCSNELNFVLVISKMRENANRAASFGLIDSVQIDLQTGSSFRSNFPFLCRVLRAWTFTMLVPYSTTLIVDSRYTFLYICHTGSARDCRCFVGVHVRDARRTVKVGFLR